MSPTTEFIDHIVRFGLAPELKAEGYTCKGRNFRRAFDGVEQIIHVQASKHNFGGSGEFTVLLGISIPAVDVLILPYGSMKPPIDIWGCTFQKGLESLRPGIGVAPWWKFEWQTSREEVAADVLAAWREVGRPFMDFATTLPGARDLMAWHRHYCPAAGASLVLNEPEAARDLVANLLTLLETTNMNFHSKVVSWANKHNVLPADYSRS